MLKIGLKFRYILWTTKYVKFHIHIQYQIWMLLLLLFFAVCGFCCLLFAVHDCESLSSKNCISNHVCVVLWVCVCVLCVFVCLCACIRLKINYRLPSSSLCCLISLTTSSAPETSINGRLSQGPANSLRSEASEAREDLRDEARLEQAVPRRLTCNVMEAVSRRSVVKSSLSLTHLQMEEIESGELRLPATRTGVLCGAVTGVGAFLLLLTPAKWNQFGINKYS